jgi:hypothetical protein
MVESIEKEHIQLSRDDVPWLPWNYYVFIYIFSVTSLIALVAWTLADGDNWIFLADQIAQWVLLLLLQTTLATLVLRCRVPVSYTRKIFNFWAFFSGAALNLLRPSISLDTYELSLAWGVWVSVVLTMVLYTWPIRSVLGCMDYAFYSIDVPEDRPNTMLIITTQFLGQWAVFIPFLVFWHAQGGKGSWPAVPIIVNGLGAPVSDLGTRYGKHLYQTKAWFMNKSLQRSWEGSVCVWLVGCFAMVIAFPGFSSVARFWLALAVIPPVLTFAEAKSHPVIDGTGFLFSCGLLTLIDAIPI